MNRSKVFIVLAILIGNFLMPSSYANTEGCPTNWKIDISSTAGIQELQAAKQRLGSDMAIDDGVIQYANYSGELGQMSQPAGGRLSYEDIYLFGNTLVQKKYTVQVKSCPIKTEFIFNMGNLKEYLSVKSLDVNKNPTEWGKTNEKYFVDFTRAGQFGECLSSFQKKFQFPGSVRAEKSGRNLNYILANEMRPFGVQACDLIGKVFLVDQTPNCRWMSPPGILPNRMGITMKIGSKCEVAVATLTRGGEFTIFQKFSIDSNNWRINIKCIRGKSTKTISGIYGYEFELKCPQGYTKK